LEFCEVIPRFVVKREFDRRFARRTRNGYFDWVLDLNDAELYNAKREAVEALKYGYLACYGNEDLTIEEFSVVEVKATVYL